MNESEGGESVLDKLLNLLQLNWLTHLLKKVRSGNVWQYSTFITYYIFFTLFPLAVGVINAFQFHGINLNLIHRLLRKVLPAILSERLINDVNLIYNRSSVGIYLIALISSIWTISWISNSLMMGMNNAYGVGHRRNIIVLRLLAFCITIGIALWFTLIGYILSVNDIPFSMDILIMTIVVFLTSWALYLVMPNVKQKVYQTLPGAFVVTGAFLLAGAIYAALMTWMPSESIFFTLLGAFTVIFMITQKMSLAILVGALANRMLIEKQEGYVRPKGEDSRFIQLLIKIKFLQAK